MYTRIQATLRLFQYNGVTSLSPQLGIMAYIM